MCKLIEFFDGSPPRLREISIAVYLVRRNAPPDWLDGEDLDDVMELARGKHEARQPQIGSSGHRCSTGR
jgi:hypothetical protein